MYEHMLDESRSYDKMNKCFNRDIMSIYLRLVFPHMIIENSGIELSIKRINQLEKRTFRSLGDIECQ